jgi:hypothetical protein
MLFTPLYLYEMGRGGGFKDILDEVALKYMSKRMV